MRRKKISSLSIILLVAATSWVATGAQAQLLDPPHAGVNAIGCTSCHQMTSTYPKLLPPLGHTPQNIDDTLANNVCWSCHNDTTAPYRVTHSSLQADNGYGNWTVECWICHNQHRQEQNIYNGSTYGKYIRRFVNLANITGLGKTGTKSVVFKGQTGANSFADGDAVYNGICEVCHTQTNHFQNDGTSADQLHGNRQGSNCTQKCHTHDNGFIHGGGGNCTECHGHEDGYGGSAAGTYFGSTQSHSTHTESDNDLIGPRPILACGDCHNTNSFPLFRSKADPNAKLTLAASDVCNDCHSESGSYDGLNDVAVGAKKNWYVGIYTPAGTALKPGKEKWCVTCHDTGTSIVNGRQAPDVARDNTATGYYISGHGAMQDPDLGRSVECADCHNLIVSHNFDGVKTYKASSNNYQTAYRLAQPLTIPNPYTSGACTYNTNDFQLCYGCHSEQTLLNDTRADGVYECNTNPFKNAAAITTSFRNMRAEGMNGGAGDWPANIHWDHLADINAIFSGNYWDSDKDGTNDSKAGCITCHNPHGASLGNGSPTKRMTRQNMQIEWGNDPTYGDYGTIGASANLGAICFSACHGPGVRYYRPAPAPVLSGMQAADINGTDPAPAESGFTNNRTVRITFTVSGTTPTEMRLAEDATFTQNATAWLPYAATYDYTLSSGDGSKTIYARLKTGSDLSDLKNTTIILDTTAPSVTATALTSPNGGQTWQQDSVQNITWSGIGDDNLKSAPITLHYSTDSGASYPGNIAAGETNDGSYTWTVPAVESTKVKVQLTAADRAGNQAADASDADFTIAAVTPSLTSFTVIDSNGADPAPAEAGYTNNQSVTVTLTASNNPTLMQVSEDPTFTAVPWIPFAATSSFSLSGGEGSKIVYCKVMNGAGESAVQNATILYDHTAPNTPLLTAPNGGELWTRNTSQAITWNNGSVTDPAPGVLKASPITLAYSTDNFTTATAIGTAMANSGSYAWLTPPTALIDLKIRLTATDRAGNRSSDDSDNPFFISPPANLIVTTTDDTVVDNLAPWNLREAIANVIANGGNDAIWFNIPDTDLGFINGVAVISISSGALPVLSQTGITIDGGSQTAIRGNTNPNGPEVRLKGSYSWYALDITAADATINGLQLTNWAQALRTVAANTTLTGNHIGFSSDTTGYDGVNNRNYGHVRINAGATSTRIGLAGKGNYISCSWIDMPLSDGGSGSVIDSNVFGLLPNGAACANSNGGFGIITLNTNAAIVRNNIICGGGSGIFIFSSNNIIQGNTFGAWYNGTSWQDCADQSEAIRNQSGGNHLIGGPNVAADDDQLNDSNVIDPGTYGINFFSSGNNTSIYGNFIGTNPRKNTNFPGTYGIYTSGQSSIKIGGGGAGESGNVITNLTGNGVYLSSASDNSIKISWNSFYGNGSSTAGSDDAIYLAAGANGSIARPSITGATTSTVTVGGVASGDTVEVFVSDYDGDGTEYGEGRTFIGSAVASTTSVNVDISGAAVSSGTWLTATRTTSAGSTSAFSANLQVP